MSTSFKEKHNPESSPKDRLQIEYLLDDRVSAKNVGQDVINGLKRSPKTLPPRYFYDSKGSQLFEAICELPEYYPTRTEAAIIEQYATEIAEVTQASELIELGSGSSTKTRLLLDAYSNLNNPFHYVPIDVSADILQDSAYRLLTDYPNLKIEGKVATYAQALEQLSLSSSHGKRIIIFLGSSIGNFNPRECDRFIERVTTALDGGDYFLLGIDLQKPQRILEAAYNDAQGVTAAFNLNMLDHLNWRFEGNFNPDLFQHQAIYNQVDHQIEMYLTSQKAHSATLNNLDLIVEFTAQESILTEISRKFNIQQMKFNLEQKGWQLINSYTDSQNWFGLLLCQKS